MIEKYISLNRYIRGINSAVRELMDVDFQEGDSGVGSGAIASILNRLLSDLERAWPKDLDKEPIIGIGLCLAEKERTKCWAILEDHIPALENLIDEYYSNKPYGELTYGILDLLHPRVTAASYVHFREARYRDAALNSIVAVFDYIRERTRLDMDGAELVANAFSLERPKLIFSTVDTESGRNEQKGFIQILQGAYLGIRNPKAHTLSSDLDQTGAAQRLV